MSNERESDPLIDYDDPNTWGENSSVPIGEIGVDTKVDLHSRDDLEKELKDKDSKLPGVMRTVHDEGKVGTIVRVGAQRAAVYVADNWETIGIAGAVIIVGVAGGRLALKHVVGKHDSVVPIKEPSQAKHS